jgi:hypothetical protein
MTFKVVEQIPERKGGRKKGVSKYEPLAVEALALPSGFLEVPFDNHKEAKKIYDSFFWTHKELIVHIKDNIAYIGRKESKESIPASKSCHLLEMNLPVIDAELTCPACGTKSHTQIKVTYGGTDVVSPDEPERN